MNKEKIILSYSGGLDTTVIIPWLMENFDYEVIALGVHVGQKEDWDDIKKRALNTGAKKCIIVDACEEYVKDYIFPALKAQAVYEDRYLLGTSTARPLIGKILAETARKEKAVDLSRCNGQGQRSNPLRAGDKGLRSRSKNHCRMAPPQVEYGQPRSRNRLP